MFRSAWPSSGNKTSQVFRILRDLKMAKLAEIFFNKYQMLIIKIVIEINDLSDITL
jgi:hypothetical protein